MSSVKTRIALAAVAAALSAPAFAEDASTSGIGADPTFPAIESPAPAVALDARAGEAEALGADPTQPRYAAAPGVQLERNPDADPRLDPTAPNAPAVRYAVGLGAPAAARIATR